MSLQISRIVLVDDHPLLGEGIVRLISSDAGLCVCGVAGNIHEGLAMTENLKPDLVITDLSMPGRNGLELIKHLAEIQPEIPVIVYSMHDEMIYAERVLRAGGRGYVTKDSPPTRLLEAIRVVLGGGVFASPAVTTHFLEAITTGKSPSKPISSLERLTDREMEVFELIGRAKNNREIASLLGISPRTLDLHRAHIRAKLGLKNCGDLISHAIRWVEIGDIGRADDTRRNP